SLRAVASSSRLLPTRPAKDFHLQSSAHARHTSTRRRNRTAVGTEEWLRRGRTEKCSVRQLSCQLFVFKLNEGADGVSIAICAQKHRVQASICLHRLKRQTTRLALPQKLSTESWVDFTVSRNSSQRKCGLYRLSRGLYRQVENHRSQNINGLRSFARGLYRY